MRTPLAFALVLTLACLVLVSCVTEEPVGMVAVEKHTCRNCISEGTPSSEPPDAGADTLYVCSFNIKWLGSYGVKENEHLADILDFYDIVVVQELVAPPEDGTYPDGIDYETDEESVAFVNEMTARGFDYDLSEEDTGSSTSVHHSGGHTEWWITFFRPDRVERADDLPHGFLSEVRHSHPVYNRVPHAFAYRTVDSDADFVLISVHLDPNRKSTRAGELEAISEWVSGNEEFEKDFIILGDMNIQTSSELEDVCPEGFVSLNADCGATNMSVNDPGPYDHAMYRPAYSSREIDESYGFWLIDLIETMEPYWEESHPDEPYPADLVEGPADSFSYYYSDHHPVEFRMVVAGADDD